MRAITFDMPPSLEDSTKRDPCALNKNTPTNPTRPVVNAPSEFTDIIGSKGRWQNVILIITLIGTLPCSWNHVGISFLAYRQDYWCSRSQNSNISVKEWWAKSIPNETIDGTTKHSQCKIYVNSSSVEEGNGTRNIEDCDEWEFDTTYKSTIIKKWHLVCSKEWMVSMSQSVYMGGFLTAALLFGQLSDRYGRHPIIMLNVAIILIFGIGTAFSTSFIMFIVMRFFVAMGNAGLNLITFVLMIEIVGAKHRLLYSFIQSFGWTFGYMILPLLAWMLKDWFYLQLVITLPCFLYISFYWILPESPRWLLTQGEIVKATAIMKKAAKANKKKIEDLETEAKKLCFKAEKEEQANKRASVYDLLRTPNLRKKTLILYFTWIVIAFVYYGLSLNTDDLGGNFFLNFFLSGAVEIPATFIYFVAIGRFGRRIPFLFFLIGSGVSCILCIFIPDNLLWLRITFAMSGKLCISSAFSIVYIYSAELFPTVVRNVGVGSCSTCARIGSMVAPFMKELGKYTNPSVPMGLFGGLSIISGLLVLLLPETSGHPLPETLEQAETFGKNKNEISMERDKTQPTDETPPLSNDHQKTEIASSTQ